MDAKANFKHKSAAAEFGAQIAKVMTWVSGFFCLVLCIVVIVNHIQVESTDPLDDVTLVTLRAAIAKEPDNQQLREAVRNLHLRARRSFFTSQSAVTTAGSLLLFGCIVFLISAKTWVELRQRLPQPFGPIPMEGGAQQRAVYRWAVGAGAMLLVLVTFVFVYLSPPPMDFSLAQTPAPPSEPPPAEPPPAEPTAAAPAPAPAKAPAEVPRVVVPPHAWPNFRGPAGLGVAHHADAPLKWNGATEENVMWKSPVPKPGTNSPIVWGGRVFVLGGEGAALEVYAFDGLTGSLLWTGSLGKVEGAPGTVPKVMDGTSTSPATAATDGERVYAIFVTGDVAAFSADSGSRVWARHLGVPKNSYGHASSLIVHGGALFVQFDDQKGGRILALDAKTGATTWEQKREVGEAWS
ncbi:MAG TPA: PQQ-binding-like beta-propeller repeat protein, partial [Planctomycetota bacterium]|nr:PQQ-binding-like beta-propeller repeat protein [Planctomycetota bacterium]